MTVDVAALVQELGLRISEGSSEWSWLLRAPDGNFFEVEPIAPVERLTAHRVRAVSTGRSIGPDRVLHIGRSATDGVVEDAEASKINILTAEPVRLICDGRSYTADPEPQSRSQLRPQRTGRPAWIRWALERYLLLTPEPSRQSVIAESLGTTQQSISRAAHQLNGLVTDEGEGLMAVDRAKLLEHWRNEYTGPGGQEFGWYSLDPVAEQVERVIDLVTLLDVKALVSGDIAADRLAPWKLPSRGQVYVTGPVDLGGDGFVAVPVEEASLVTCVPRDPSLWWLAPPTEEAAGSDGLPIADAAIVYWDLLTSTDPDSEEAAAQVAALLIGGPR
ncbi:hypothetical protein J6397_31785 [Rhodococcus qingshengii]|uniref:hypothetical protein n=1 Tax=Rhodococcus qingshengii TaxID=334542 RepID=UPI001AEA1E66|nr:hypothetical protein [Rhodococcus qingshengii]MBP1054709.1 hypothetical protein [Rhodococcus qingshengii]